MPPTKPNVTTFLIADKVIQEKGTNKWSAIGIFNRLSAPVFPCLHNTLGLYLRLTDAQGDYDVKIRFCDSHDRDLAMFQGIKLHIPSKLAHQDFGINTRQLPIPKEGRYHFRLYFNDELVEQIALDVIKSGTEQQEVD